MGEARAARLDPARRTPLGMIGGALLLMLLADIAFALEGFGTTYSLGDPADAAWMLSYALMGAALLHPSLIPQAPRPPLKFRPMPPGWVPPLAASRADLSGVCDCPDDHADAGPALPRRSHLDRPRSARARRIGLTPGSRLERS